MPLFGLAKDVPTAFALRFACGLFNGVEMSCKIMISEVWDAPHPSPSA
jgi:hypothetical protein